MTQPSKTLAATPIRVKRPRMELKRLVLDCMRDLMHDESGQDLVEYALVAALVGLGATASMRTLATTVSTALTAIGTRLSGSV
jgi:pilus assembly protein Flp/PilA